MASNRVHSLQLVMVRFSLAQNFRDIQFLCRAPFTVVRFSVIGGHRDDDIGCADGLVWSVWIPPIGGREKY